MLVYPVYRLVWLSSLDSPAASPSGAARYSSAALLGRSRAAVLQSSGECCTTVEVA
ncbi:transcriptional regulator, partial [Micromonospora arborensis]